MKIDSTYPTEKVFEQENVAFLDVREEPFQIYGLYEPKKGDEFIRLPIEVAKNTNEGVLENAYHTAGGRVRFATDSPFLAVRAKIKKMTRFPHMPRTGTSGFDLYEHGMNGRDYYVLTFTPMEDEPGWGKAIHSDYVEQEHIWVSLRPTKTDGKLHYYTIHFPLYNDLVSLEIGVEAGCEVLPGADYAPIPPVVYYGSSITQGGCASRPGNAYQNIISARNNIDHINLGFSGSARGEEIMAEYIAGLKMSVLVMDYDANAPSPEHLEKTHERFFQIIREKNPELPVIFVTIPRAPVNEMFIRRRSIIYNTFRRAFDSGDRNVSFLDGYSLFDAEYYDVCTVDGVHPNDAGFVGMAKVIGNELSRVLNHRVW